MFSRSASATRLLYYSLPNRAARVKYHHCDEPEARNQGPGVDCASSLVLLETPESTMPLVPSLAGQQETSLPLKEEPVSGHHDPTGASFLGGENDRRIDEIPQCNDPSSCMTDDCFEPLAITGGVTGGDRKGVGAAGPSFRVTDGPTAKEAPVFLSCLVNVEVEEPAYTPTAGYFRSSTIQPATAVMGTNSNVGHRKPRSDHEYDDEDEEDEQRSSDDEDMPAYRPRITGFIGSKVAFKRQAVRPGNQADLARNRKLRLEVTRARHHIAAAHLITDDAVFLASRSSLPVAELLSKMEKLALGRAVRSSRFTCNLKRF
ncbi:hypothetical protein HPB51_004730 [Rhipicephalus microplus]|uniref:Uncharacterized protein n=1 Tax=Rhipicephalus microplus TaxID=6941 RepID=A0A9J6DSM9_RHIMP|nr:hypothetical protein HPB51_004730 [Rhipicephalus microplus]